MRSSLSLLLAVVLLAGCATTGKVAGKPRPEVLEFDPILVTPGPKEELDLAGMNDEELFALGTNAFGAQDFEKAARCFTRLADTFPQSKHHAEASFNAGLSLERLGKFDLALERFKPLMDPAKGTGDALDASFRTAECYYHLDQYAPAIEILTTIAAREDVGTQDRLQAKVHRGICQIEDGQLDEAEKSLRDALNFWFSRREADRLDEYFPGQAQFFLGEIYRLYFERVELDPDQGEDKLGKDLEFKCELLLSAQGHYLRAIRIGDGQWATASGFRIGALYETLYEVMVNAKVPKELDEEQGQIYREELHKKVRILVSKAISTYERTLAAAERIGVDNPFISKTRESLDRLKQILLEAPAETPPDPAATPAVPEKARPAS